VDTWSSDAQTRLPVALTRLVGRQVDISTVKNLLSESRLVTLIGAGGIGKTRLALEVARQTAEEYPDGAWFVDLAPLQNADMVPNVVLATLGLDGQATRTPTATLIRSIASRGLLCVLDNCEHLVEACAELAEALLQQCAGLRILATSRQVLGVVGETTWRVPALRIPNTSRPMPPDELERFDTVQLLLQRAQAALPSFALTAETAGPVARICQRLDGIPLAIELAAARVRTLPISEIDRRIKDRFQVLTTGSRTSPPRHRTLQATLDWSHDLLGDAERRVFRRLSVFRGGFSYEAAEVVCADSDASQPTPSVLDGLSSLIDKSLVILEQEVEEAPHLLLLETVREYAHAQLQSAGEVEAIEGRHAAYYLALADQIWQGLRGGEQGVWYARVDSEFDNLRACFEWGLEHDPRSALQLTIALERYWIMFRRGEGYNWVWRSLAAVPESSEVRAHALSSASFLTAFQGEFDEARRLADECLALARDLGSVVNQARALSLLGIIAGWERLPGWPRVSLTLFKDAERLARQSGDYDSLTRILNNQGVHLDAAGNSDQARGKLREGLVLATEHGDMFLITLIEGSLGDAELHSGDRRAAEASWRHELELAGGMGALMTAVEALTGLARLAHGDGEEERSLRLLGAATEFFRRTAGVVDAPDASLAREVQDAGRRVVGAEKAEAAWREGTGMSLAEAVRFALGVHLPRAPQTTPSHVAPVVAAASTSNVFAQEGDFWTLRFASQLVRAKDSKGLRDISVLLASPGREIAAVDLAGARSALPTRPSRIPPLTGEKLSLEVHAGPVLDTEARQQYRQRLADLEDELARAEAYNDPERVSHLREERAFLLDELSAAFGLGGRHRWALDPAERARKAVTGRIREAIGHIEAVHPELGQHLRRSVRTGAFCVYDPSTATEWRLSVAPREFSSARSARHR
jgi:non-specific serine/threonine protein kinase